LTGIQTRAMDAEQIKISVVMPVFNEAATVVQVIERVLECGFDCEVIAVDDASTDGTRDILKNYRNPRVRCLFHSVNRGKGAALRLGFAAARNQFVVVQDADLEYDPNDFHVLLQPLVDGRAEMVYGSRFLGGPHRVLFFWHYVINRGLTLLANALCNLNLDDMETGMKAFRRDRLTGLTLTADRFTFEPEITVKAARAGWRIYEVPISYSGRTYAEGKKIGWRDGVATVAALLYYRVFD
jgi:glycosyltransferase involved in cell wall biosynthesis